MSGVSQTASEGMGNMKLLISNDDGIFAQGIGELARALAQVAEVYVCAPDSQRSASGHGITVSGPILVEEVEFPGVKKALSCSGTPADCVKLGLSILEREGIRIDMVFSGINHGANLGTDVLYSGTVSAAIEGILSGVPAVAVSVNNHQPKHFEAAAKIAVNTFLAVSDKLDSSTVLNINIPDLPEEEISGIRYTTLGMREYAEEFEERQGPNGKKAYGYAGVPVMYQDLPETVDVIADQDGFISITPLHYDLTNHQLVKEVRGWGIRL